MKEKQLQKECDSLESEIKKLQKQMDSIKKKRDAKWYSLLNARYPKFIGKYFIAMEGSSKDGYRTKWYVYIHVIRMVDDAFEIEKFWIEPVVLYENHKVNKFVIEKNLYPCYWIHKEAEISKKEYEKKKTEMIKKMV